MGLAKARMMELQEEQYHQAHWECPECDYGNISEIDIPPINTAAEKASDMQASDTAFLHCEDCETEFEGLIHHNMFGLEFDFRDKAGKSIVIEHISQFSQDEYDYEYEDIWVPSDDPYDVFEVTMQGMHNLMSVSSPSPHDKQLLKRVIFSQIITALEAYLADTLIKLVKGDIDVQHKLYSNDKHLKKVTFEAAKIIKRPHIPENYLVNWLQRKSFHDFPMVDNLFKIALGVSIYESKEARTLLDEARLHRHDCVHRNGKTVEGDKLDIFDTAYVESIASAAGTLAHNIEIKVVAYENAKAFKEILENNSNSPKLGLTEDMTKPSA